MGKMTKDEIIEIMELLQKAYSEAGKKITTGVLYEADAEPEIIVDNRTDKDIN